MELFKYPMRIVTLYSVVAIVFVTIAIVNFVDRNYFFGVLDVVIAAMYVWLANRRYESIPRDSNK